MVLELNVQSKQRIQELHQQLAGQETQMKIQAENLSQTEVELQDNVNRKYQLLQETIELEERIG